MTIERKSLMNNPLGIAGAVMAARAGIDGVWVVDDKITVLRRTNGTFSMMDHSTGKEPSKQKREEIEQKIKGDKL